MTSTEAVSPDAPPRIRVRRGGEIGETNLNTARSVVSRHRHPQHLGRLDLWHRGGLGDDIAPRRSLPLWFP
jgi:hypothetical protein